MDNYYKRSYDRYAELFNKACSSVLFLIIAILTSLLTLGNVINVFNVLSTGDTMTIIFAILPALFLSFTTIALWKFYANAKSNSVNSEGFGMLKAYPKYDQVIKSILFVIIILTILALVIGLFSIKFKVERAMDEVGAGIEDLQDELRDSLYSAEDFPEEYLDIANKFIDKIDFFMTTGLVIVTVIAVIAITAMILELIRCGKLVKFIISAGKMLKTGYMEAPPSMFFCILNYIFGGITIIGAFGLNLTVTVNGNEVLTTANSFVGFDLVTMLTGVTIILVGVIINIHRKELVEIYNAWQFEMSTVPANNAMPNGAYMPNYNYANQQQFAPQAPIQNPYAPQMQQPIQQYNQPSQAPEANQQIYNDFNNGL